MDRRFYSIFGRAEKPLIWIKASLKSQLFLYTICEFYDVKKSTPQKRETIELMQTANLDIMEVNKKEEGR